MQKYPPPRLHISGVTFVQPAKPINPIQFSCSAVENLCARVHHSAAHFFPIRRSANVEQIFHDLKQGLSLVMNEHPVIAGTLRQGERGDFSVEIPPAPHAGAFFHFSDISNDPEFPSFAELQECGFPYMDGDLDGLKEFRPDPFPTNEDGQAIFVTKICHVRGGIVWTGSLSHLVTDLAQGTAVMLGWAKYTKQVTEAAGKPISIPKQLPWPDRKRLLPEVDGPIPMEEIGALNQTLEAAAYFVLDPTDPEKMVDDIGNIFLKADVSEANPDQHEYFMEPSSGIWRFTPSKLRTLTDAVRRVDPDVKLSPFDVVTAFIWQRLCMAKRGSKRGNEPPTAQIVTAMNVRRKLNPPLPATFLGACVDLVRVCVDREVLDPQKDQWKSISGIAKSVRQFGAVWNEADYMAMLKLSLRTPMCPGLLPKGPIDMLVTDHTMFSLTLRADWGGELGCSIALREPYISRETPRGELIILPRQPNGDLDVIISAEEIVLERLLVDIGMSTVCENVCVRHNVLESFTTMAMKKAKL
ncbi:hypothetical protein BKA61DRAFT_722009 [Leptodontidium sp. MPI-SDFR-AT-0119]|nr:hypothetical protein BKA61DRAFT_722009 [Leptodontidium sp. MPI-SDFR-AT-0119]